MGTVEIEESSANISENNDAKETSSQSVSTMLLLQCELFCAFDMAEVYTQEYAERGLALEIEVNDLLLVWKC